MYPFLICFRICMSKISDKTDKFLLKYSNLSWVHFVSGHSILSVFVHAVVCRTPICLEIFRAK